jgi:hypothetical protein
MADTAMIRVDPDSDLDWNLRACYALLNALPKVIETTEGIRVQVHRANDPAEVAGGNVAGMVSPLFRNSEDDGPEILISLKKEGFVDAIFHIRQVGSMLVRDGERDAVLPAAPDPLDGAT